MRTIAKSANPPGCLEQQPADQNWSDFSRTDCHVLVSDSLRTEQHFLCCYCEGEIDEFSSHIEHLEPRSRARNKTYSYDNMASSCKSSRHCGQKKGREYDAGLFIHPHDPALESVFSYGIDGSVTSAKTDSERKFHYMESVLNLNCPALVGRRYRHARQLIETLGAAPLPELVEWAREYFLQQDDEGRLRQFHSLSKAVLEGR